MTATLFPQGKQYYSTSTGAPNVGGKVYTYAAGTTTPLATYSDAAGAVPNTNPVVLDARGEALIFWNGNYKVVLKDLNDNTIWTVDNVRATDYAASDGSSHIGFIQAGTGAVERTSQEKMRERISVIDYGADPTGVLDSAPAFKRARDYMQAASNFRGGVIYVPKGTYKLNDEITCTPYVAGQVFSLTWQGDGPEATVLDFIGAAPGTNGIAAFGKGVGFYVKGMSIKNAKVSGVVIKGGNIGTTDYIQRCGIENVRIQGSGSHGFYTENSFFIDVINCWSFGNGGSGYFFGGFHTTVSARGSWAYLNAADTGWRLNGLYGGSFINCYGEFCLTGWTLTNCQAVNFSGCGAENNTREGYSLLTGNAFIAVGLPSECHDINISMSACKGTQNSTAGVNLWANFMSGLTANSRGIQVTLGGGIVSKLGTSSTYDFVLNGASGTIDIWGYTTTGKVLSSTNNNVGSVVLH